MLTPTEIHYVVGFLSLATNPENVEIELGDFVYDAASQTGRDVDVTITTLNADGSRSALRGIEVQAHRRALGSDDVEQLIQKLADMPSITHRGIVSASGFTKPAVKKAAHHGVELYELQDWNPEEGFDYFKPKPMAAARETYRWIGPLEIRINPGRSHTDEEKGVLGSKPEMQFENPPNEKFDLESWLRRVADLAAKEASAKAGNYPKEGTIHIPASVTVNFSDNARAVSEGRSVSIVSVRYNGTVERRIEQIPSVTKALYKMGDPQPMAGCAISDFGDFGLVALIVSNRRTIELARVPVSDRNKQKIFNQRMIKRTEDSSSIATD